MYRSPVVFHERALEIPIIIIIIRKYLVYFDVIFIFR